VVELPFLLLSIALVGSIFAGLSCSTIGIFVVRMNLVSIGYCMSHAAFAGAALGLLINIDPLFGAIVFSLVTALVLGPLSEKAKLESNVIIGFLFSIMIALAFIFLNMIPGTAATGAALNILWGSVFMVNLNDLLLLGMLSFVILLFFTLFYKELVAILFHRKLAEASGINTRIFFFAILFLIGFTVSISLKLVGGLLVFTLIVNPTSTAYQFFFDFKKISLASPIIGITSCLIGFLVSLEWNLPIGAAIVVVSSLIFAFSILISPKRRRGKKLLS